MNDTSSLRLLHRRLAAAMGLSAITAFISGAGLETPTPVIAAVILILSMVWTPDDRLQRKLDPAWRILALVLAARAAYRVFASPDDVVLPMVDLLLVLLVSETAKRKGAAGDTRVYSLSFALLIAACAYRPGIAFGLSFVAYTGVATVTLMVGHLIRKLSEHDARNVRLDRAFLLRTASLSSVMLALSALFFAAFPRVSRGWMTRNVAPAANVVGFSDRVSLAEHGGRIYANPEIVLRVEFPMTPPPASNKLYWRGRSYDFFDGVAWSRSPGIPRSGTPTSVYGSWWPGRRMMQRVFAVPLDVPVLFGLHPVLNVQPQSRIRALKDNVGDMWYFGPGEPIYDVVSAWERPLPDQLRAAVGPPLAGEEYYLELPVLSRSVQQLADSLTAHASNRYDAVMSVQSWLQTQFRYTLDLPANAREATLEYFLFRRKAGHCEYFSTALAILLRAVGIPTRNVNGFLGGTWNDFGGFLTVTQNQAHSWVEVYFPGYGWVPFDGTAMTAADVAQLRTHGFGTFRNLLDGLEHRWNKWILEYNIEKQVSVFRRVTEPFARRTSSGRVRWNPALTRALEYALAGIVLVLILRQMGRRARVPVTAVESRIYVKLRRAYERAGYGSPGFSAPMRFAAMLEREDAPGQQHARRAIELYLRARFGGEELGEPGRRALRRAADDALRALRAA